MTIICKHPQDKVKVQQIIQSNKVQIRFHWSCDFLTTPTPRLLKTLWCTMLKWTRKDSTTFLTDL